ncbi:DegT/DnrJ/EryC1/StrS family aminotransferase [Atlantibacter sp.]|uniref:DegT/DnrJ/EryC1/StrS family aminotransferase n=1 Tax=Atlantibacter sp. TaxID=1903473 RepID=UPI0028AF8102|nr:DegT/DnrJ/EryC1/StrS family aminotransferase [Atlantibacter sp.]
MNSFISYGEPSIGCIINEELIDKFIFHIQKHLRSGVLTANDLISTFELEFQKCFDESNFCVCNNATTGIELVLYLIKKIAGFINVTTQAIGFFGVYSMIISRGYSFSLCDTELNSFNFNLDDLKEQLESGVNVIIITHMNGIPADSKKIKEIADDYSRMKGYKIWIVDDLSRCLGSRIENHNISFWSDFSIYSFQSKKHLTLLGEGGGIVSNEFSHHQMIRNAINFGNKKFFGFNHKISFSQVLFGNLLLNDINWQINKRINLGKNRDNYLKDKSLFSFVYPTTYNHLCSYYLYTLKVNDEYPSYLRDEICYKLKKYSIGTCIANLPVYKTSSYIKENIKNIHFPNAESLANRIFSVSLHPSYDVHDENYILQNLFDISDYYGN